MEAASTFLIPPSYSLSIILICNKWHIWGNTLVFGQHHKFQLNCINHSHSPDESHDVSKTSCRNPQMRDLGQKWQHLKCNRTSTVNSWQCFFFFFYVLFSTKDISKGVDNFGWFGEQLMTSLSSMSPEAAGPRVAYNHAATPHWQWATRVELPGWRSDGDSTFPKVKNIFER